VALCRKMQYLRNFRWSTANKLHSKHFGLQEHAFFHIARTWTMSWLQEGQREGA
jgi:hypothetical protein